MQTESEGQYKMYDLISTGEILIDFLDQSAGAKDTVAFLGAPGGAPCNALAQAAKLGRHCAFLGKVGEDMFGTFLKDFVAGLGIDTRYLLTTDEANTTLAFVKLDEGGDRSFSFYRKPGADTLLSKEDIDPAFITDCGIFLYGSVSMSMEPERSAVFYMLELLQQQSCLRAYDPNLRFNLWSSREDARHFALKGMEHADILKLSEEEILFLSGKATIEEGIAHLMAKYPIKMVLATLGKYGCELFWSGKHQRFYTYDTKTVDTTAAGDSFFGAFLSCLKGYNRSTLGELTFEQLSDMVDFANAAGALTTSKKGAITSMPGEEEIRSCMVSVPKLIL
ncbi:carbohydrate kinase [Oscillospiraceae bacterium MB08-C2-2]|nr:carbohydrate kinase [Oscillospiraceae bacterium MB08-C2-2]